VHPDAGESVLMGAATIRRVRRAAMSTLAGVVVIAASSSCTSPGASNHADYCAIFPDTIGLYVGNPVTQMGYQIGKITSIGADLTQVRVGFAVTRDRPLPRDVKAIVRSPSILADRSLELVGNYSAGPRLDPGGCIALDHSFSPKSISEVVGSADTFIKAINPDGSTNLGDTIRGVDKLAHNNGAGINKVLTTSSALLDSPDRAVSDIGSIMRNTAELTSVLKELMPELKEVLQDARTTTPNLANALDGTTALPGAGGGVGTLGPVAELVAVLQTRLGDETQQMLDTVSVTVRKLAPHANALSDLMTPVPWWINTIANHFNRRDFHTFNLAYRPPLYRVPTHNGLALCGMMNTRVPGSCADVNGQPFAVDVALLQFVLTEAAKR
jgi:phospholipid/cholesterol/gamma-HCH transport system substrate-binding protein